MDCIFDFYGFRLTGNAHIGNTSIKTKLFEKDTRRSSIARQIYCTSKEFCSSFKQVKTKANVVTLRLGAEANNHIKRGYRQHQDIMSTPLAHQRTHA
jgi:hypothetical protein